MEVIEGRWEKKMKNIIENFDYALDAAIKFQIENPV